MRYRDIADSRWSHASWILGNGRFAVLAHCKRLTVLLCDNWPQAEREKTRLDQVGCCGVCDRAMHEIVDMELPAKDSAQPPTK